MACWVVDADAILNQLVVAKLLVVVVLLAVATAVVQRVELAVVRRHLAVAAKLLLHAVARKRAVACWASCSVARKAA